MTTLKISPPSLPDVFKESSSSPHSPLNLSWPASVPTESITDNLLHFTQKQLGIGEVNRFTISIDRSTLTSLEHDDQGNFIWLVIKNSELDLLRPIYITGPFTLYVDVTPRNYFHLEKFDEDIQYDPDVKPGQHFSAKLRFTKNSLLEADIYEWRVDVVSQLALTTAFHIKYTLSIGYQYTLLRRATDKHLVSGEGTLNVMIEDTKEIWNRPPMDCNKPVHLVIITHGIFSNVGADMLYIKDRIEDITSRNTGSNVMVRGYDGNVGKSERGIKYLGKRVAEYVLETVEKTQYDIDRISFIGHSLGGPVQAYALAHILWTKPDFFKTIVPVNFVIMASPMLGMTEFPTAVSIALDMGMLGITGRDLTLRHKFPSVMKKTKGSKPADEASSHLTTKPVLEQILLPPTHELFQKFMTRTLYANAIHDGIVPLRTSALLYLDWRGLGDIERLRKQYDENAGAVADLQEQRDDSEKSGNRPRHGTVGEIPKGDDTQSKPHHTPAIKKEIKRETAMVEKEKLNSSIKQHHSGLALVKKPSSLFTQASEKKKRKKLRKYIRTQTVQSKDQPPPTSSESESSTSELPTSASTENETNNENGMDFHVPPVASTILTAANVLKSPQPEPLYLTNPSARPPSIFHDKTYTFDDLPPAHYTKRHTLKEAFSRDKKGLQERLARSWHDGMEWRKVLVTLKPDAHNNIAVRRRYVNAWGWGVVDHMVENHFGYGSLEREHKAVEMLREI